jgi:tRNA threonylcarbamoyl adenosine modification protein YjeE
LLKAGDRVFLEGEMGAGKTTFARALLAALGVVQPPEGSPSFAIAHEYDSHVGNVIHIDFYRLKHESEIEDAGIGAYFWERQAIVVAEWISMFPEFAESVTKAASRNVPSRRVWKVSLAFSERSGVESVRDVEISLESR